MKSPLFKLLPSPAVTLSLLMLPIVFTIYFAITRYSQDFIIEQNVNYFDVQSSWLGKILVEQSYLDWFNRFMDFAFWGVLALIVLVGIWAVSSARVSLENHYAQEKFVNFRENKATWHWNFYVVVVLKIILIIVILYSFFAIVGKYIPQLSVGVSEMLIRVTPKSIQAAALGFAALFAYQFLIVASVKIFKHLRAD